VVQNAAAASAVTSGGAAIVTHLAPVTNRRCRQSSSWSWPKTAATIIAAATNPSHGRATTQCARCVGQVGAVIMRSPRRSP
jgi:hypothetical protein